MPEIFRYSKIKKFIKENIYITIYLTFFQPCYIYKSHLRK